MKPVCCWISIALFLSCGRIGEGKDKINQYAGKAHEMADSVYRRGREKLLVMLAKEPDSLKYKAIYTDFFRKTPPADVALDSTFQVYTDYLGIDIQEMLSFRCSPETALDLAEHLDLKRSDGQEPIHYGFRTDFDWWDVEILKKHIPYVKIKEDSHEYIWYVPSRKQLYYLYYTL